MKFTKNWHVGHGADTEIRRYDPEQSPPTEDIDAFVAAAKLVGKLRPFQCMRYVLRDVRWTSAWLKAYVAWHVEDLNATFIKDGKSFYIALLESPTTGDRSVAFRLTTAGLGGHTQWKISLRRVNCDGTNEFFLCAE